MCMLGEGHVFKCVIYYLLLGGEKIYCTVK